MSMEMMFFPLIAKNYPLQQPDKLLHQLLHDESFSGWVHQTDASAMAYWDAWIVQHPEHRAMVEDAARMVRGIPFAVRQLPEHEIQQAWLDLRYRLPAATPSHRMLSRRVWLRVVAGVAILLLAGALAWWITSEALTETTYATSYGETKAYTLPDGSQVILNAHSQLTYRELTHPKPVREVFLEGEAFFSVVHRGQYQPLPFVVHTSDLAVQVLGTKFNVNTRRGRTQVVLDAGQVELQLPSEEKTAMQPGELVEYKAEDAKMRKQIVDTELFIAWRERRLKFDDTPLAEVALLLEENYGVTIAFDDPQLGRKRVTGEISAREVDTILTALSTLFTISIQRSGDRIHISEQHVTS